MDRLEVAIEAQASAAVNELNKLESALGRVAGKLAGIKTPSGLGATGKNMTEVMKRSSKMGIALNSLTSLTSQYGTSARTAASNTKSLANAGANLYMKFHAVKRMFSGMWSTLEKSMDYIEVLNYFDVAFGAIGESVASAWKEAGYDSAQAYVDSFAERAKQLTSKMTGMSINDNGTLTPTGQKSLGMDPEQLMNYQAGFAQMSNSIGVTSEMSLKLSNALTMLGADLASVKNITQTSHIKNGNRSLKNQYFSSQNSFQAAL